MIDVRFFCVFVCVRASAVLSFPSPSPVLPAVYALYVMHILMFYESFQVFGLQKDKEKNLVHPFNYVNDKLWMYLFEEFKTIL